MPVAGGRPNRESYVSAWGVHPDDFPYRFSYDGELSIEQIDCSVPCNLVYPGEQPTLTLQLRNHGAEPVRVKGEWLMLGYGLRTNGDDVFNLSIVPEKAVPFEHLDVELPAGGLATLRLSPELPERFGAWAILLEREGKHRLFAGSVARILEPAVKSGAPYCRICMDIPDAEAVKRLHTAPNRIGVPYFPRRTAQEKERAEREYAGLYAQLEELRAAGYPVCLEFGAGADRGETLPLGRTRPHLDANGVMLETKSDFAWLPAYDSDFRELVRELVARFGYPRGPVNGLMLWNEPWNGISISGWGADDLRYRELYTAMCEGAEQAMRENPELQVLLGGCDSSSNTFDKLFPDDDMRFLERLDFMSLHYQGFAPSNPRMLRDRKHPKNGRTLFWDTESWVANSEDRVPGVLAGMFAAGHDRLVGIQGNGVVVTPYQAIVYAEDGTKTRRKQYQAWPVAPALAAAQHFMGNRVFERLLWEGLPWVFLFRGENPEDMTAVVCGDLAPAFDGRGRGGIVPFRTARGKHPPQGEMRLSGADGIGLYDGNGNRLPAMDGVLTIPLNDSGYYLRPDGTPGSAERLLAALQAAQITGYASPVAPGLRDSLRPIGDGAVFTATCRNLLNRPVTGTLCVEAAGLTLSYEAVHTIPPHAEIEIPLVVTGGAARPDNRYAMRLRFDCGDSGCAEWEEVLHCNLIANAATRPDWKTTGLAQSVFDGGGGATMMERAWLPMVEHAAEEATTAEGAAVFRFAHDDDFFYLSADIPDTTPDVGMPRFATRDEDADFYPETAYEYDSAKTFAAVTATARPAAAPAALPREAWAPLCDSMAFVVSGVPEDGGGVLSLTFLDDDGMLRRFFRVTVRHADAAHAAGDFAREFRPMADASRIRIPLRGAARVEVTRLNWLKPLLVQVDLDANDATTLTEPQCVPLRASEPVPARGALVSLRSGEQSVPEIAWDGTIEKLVHRWPEGVRRYSYRKRPVLPQGPGFDTVQLGFNILPDEQKRWYPMAPGTFKGYAATKETDYEFALNPVAEAYGGGTEIWKNLAPYLPDKHYYPRSPKHPREGAVGAPARLEIERDEKMRHVFLALPWTEIPEVLAARREGRPVKLTVRVNDNGRPGACMELPCGRSASRRSQSLKPDWGEHWANEIEFGWE